MIHASSCARARARETRSFEHAHACISVSTRECVCTMIYSQSFRAMGSHEAARSLACLIILLKGPQQFYISRGLERNSERRCSLPALLPLLLSWARTMSRAIWLSFLLSPSLYLVLALSLCWGISLLPVPLPSSYATLLDCLFPLYLVLCASSAREV